MLTRGVAAVVLLIALGQGANAGDKPNVFHRASCVVVRYYVAKYSEGAAEAWARSQGATDAEVETARSCLAGSRVQAANLRK